jgi:multicomponent Na+:H+ antiporter subunit D
MTPLSMLKIWSEAFWKPPPGEDGGGATPPSGRQGVAGMLLPCAALTAAAVALGLGAGPASAIAARAGAELLHPAGYIAAVLGSPRAGGL